MIVLELSNDIKGERIRFVDAMKEATAINVQCASFFNVHSCVAMKDI